MTCDNFELLVDVITFVIDLIIGIDKITSNHE